MRLHSYSNTIILYKLHVHTPLDVGQPVHHSLSVFGPPLMSCNCRELDSSAEIAPTIIILILFQHMLYHYIGMYSNKWYNM